MMNSQFFTPGCGGCQGSKGVKTFEERMGYSGYRGGNGRFCPPNQSGGAWWGWTAPKPRKTMGEAELRAAIRTFFVRNPRPSDKQVHALASDLGINKHRFEEIIYKMLGELLQA